MTFAATFSTVLAEAPKEISAGFVVLMLLVGLVSIAIYFLPTYIAWRRGHLNTGAIFMLNLLLGWLFLGWVVAIVWACTSNVSNKDARAARVGCPLVPLVGGVAIVAIGLVGLFLVGSAMKEPSTQAVVKGPRTEPQQPANVPNTKPKPVNPEEQARKIEEAKRRELEEEKRRAEESRQKQEAEAKQRAAEEAKLKAAEEAARKAEEEQAIKDELLASNRLDAAKKLTDFDLRISKFREIAVRYPKTKAGEEARELLKKFGK